MQSDPCETRDEFLPSTGHNPHAQFFNSPVPGAIQYSPPETNRCSAPANPGSGMITKDINCPAIEHDIEYGLFLCILIRRADYNAEIYVMHFNGKHLTAGFSYPSAKEEMEG
ncbi:hypothetical protein ASPNIDRAFT_41231 [Aspergillus niger ATCC 1015]|uniref:Uncharacterized protein n=1 Tax=Aspergillus niger (strain ATCC 1015 / CBS 113.46 / FGSC A1144 / LSHB Ac4 / NCTC 3858a / NRRL 328 / USDA 3528.7) TaxID=380704 RepID=G3Y5I3_ASPNA|nr:hypothetical protein ASPNIDRAFT_41231 [Aspergillus niger ATCC 1015]